MNAGLATLQFKAEQWGDVSNGWNAPLVTGSLFASDGISRDQCGLSGPMSSWLTVNDTAFHGFAEGSAAICACHLCNGGKGGIEIRTNDLRFTAIGEGARVKFAHHHFEAILFDVDGSLTGEPQGWMHAASHVVLGGSLGHFPNTSCSLTSTGHSRHVPSAVICKSDVRLRTFRWRHVQPQDTFAGRAAIVSTSYGSSLVPWQKYDILIRTSNHHFTIVSGVRHTIDFMENMAYPIDHEGWGAGEMCELRADEHYLIETPTLTDPHRWEFEGNEVEYPASYGSLDSLPPPHQLNGFWQYAPVGTDRDGAPSQGNLQMLVSAKKATIAANHVQENAPGVGGYGGTCTCPDGEILYAGDNYDGCSSIACINGIPGPCTKTYRSEWANKRVTCAQPTYPLGNDAQPSCSENPKDCHEGQRCVSATLVRHECPPVGCFVDTDHCLGDNRVFASSVNVTSIFSWCDASAGWMVPGPNANVTIPAGTTVTLSSCTTALVHKLDVYGTLRFVDGSASVLKARYIHVAANTGRLEVGTLDAPFLHFATIQLYGNRSTAPYPNSGLGSKFLVNFGELSLVGRPRPTVVGSWWTQLVGSTSEGDMEIHLPSDWVTAIGLSSGDELVIAPSGLQWNESETVTVRSTSINITYPGSVVVQLTSAVQFEHKGLVNSTWLGQDHPFLAAEVALLRTGDERINNIVVEGLYDAEETDFAQEFGAKIAILQKTDQCPSVQGNAPPTANISGVLFRNCGQRGYETYGCIYVGPQQRTNRARFDYEWDAAGGVSISASTIVASFNTGIQLDRVHGVVVQENVLYSVHDYGIKVEGQRNQILSNLVIHVADSFDKVNALRGGRKPWPLRWRAGTVYCFGLHHTGRDGVLRGNLVAGSEGIGVLSDGHECGVKPTIDDNIVHSAVLGLWYEDRSTKRSMSEIYGTPLDGLLGMSSRAGYPISPDVKGLCYELTSWRIHSTVLYGAHSGRLLPKTYEYAGNRNTLVYRNFTLIDTGIAFSHASEGPDSTHHDRTRPDLHWLVDGATVLASNYRCRQIGFVAANFHNVGLPFGPHGIDMHGVRQSPSLYGGSILRNVFFDGFGTAYESGFEYPSIYEVTCEAGDRNLAISNDAPPVQGIARGERGGDGIWSPNVDASNPVRLSGISFGANVEATSRYAFVSADSSFIGLQGCAQIDCDGRRNTLFMDDDGSLLGSPGTIIAQNEIRFNDALTYVDPLGAGTPADLLPGHMMTNADGSTKNAAQVYDAEGISRDASAGACTWAANARAYECVGGQHRQLIVEDVHHDAMERRIAPVALLVDRYVSLATGPQNYAISYVEGHTARLNTFWLVGVLGRTHEIHFTSTVPQKLRLHLRDVTTSESLLVRVQYAGLPNRVDAYVAGQKVEPALDITAVNYSAAHGTSFHDVETTSLTVLLKGPQPVELIVAPAVTLGIGLAISTQEFFSTGYDGLVSNIALLLGIPRSRIRIPGAASRRRRLGGHRILQEGANTDVQVVIDGRSPSAIADTNVITTESNLAVDLALQSFNAEMAVVQANLTSAVGAGVLSAIVVNATGSPPSNLNVSDVEVPIPGWTGPVTAYGTGDGCHCGYGLLDPDCGATPVTVLGCEPLQTISTLSATALDAGAGANIADDDDDNALQLDPDDGSEGEYSLVTQIDLSVITPIRICTATHSTPNVTVDGNAIVLGVCQYTLPGWSGNGADYNTGDGVCHCDRGLWDPDCDTIDFASPELNASSFGCPADGNHYVCYKETRGCFTDNSGGRPQGICLIATASPVNCPAMNSALDAASAPGNPPSTPLPPAVPPFSPPSEPPSPPPMSPVSPPSSPLPFIPPTPPTSPLPPCTPPPPLSPTPPSDPPCIPPPSAPPPFLPPKQPPPPPPSHPSPGSPPRSPAPSMPPSPPTSPPPPFNPPPPFIPPPPCNPPYAPPPALPPPFSPPQQPPNSPPSQPPPQPPVPPFAPPPSAPPQMPRPPMAPGATVREVHEAVAELVVAGDLSSFDERRQSDLRERFASGAGVELSAVSVHVAAASVLITVTIRTTGAEVAAGVASNLSTALANSTAASSFAGVQVLVAPRVATQTVVVVIPAPLPPPPPRTPPSPPPVPSPTSGTQLMRWVSVSIGGTTLVMILFGCKIWLKRRQRDPKRAEQFVHQVTTPAAPTTSQFGSPPLAQISVDTTVTKSEHSRRQNPPSNSTIFPEVLSKAGFAELEHSELVDTLGAFSTRIHASANGRAKSGRKSESPGRINERGSNQMQYKSDSARGIPSSGGQRAERRRSTAGSRERDNGQGGVRAKSTVGRDEGRHPERDHRSHSACNTRVDVDRDAIRHGRGHQQPGSCHHTDADRRCHGSATASSREAHKHDATSGKGGSCEGTMRNATSRHGVHREGCSPPHGNCDASHHRNREGHNRENGKRDVPIIDGARGADGTYDARSSSRASRQHGKLDSRESGIRDSVRHHHGSRDAMRRKSTDEGLRRQRVHEDHGKGHGSAEHGSLHASGHTKQIQHSHTPGKVKYSSHEQRDALVVPHDGMKRRSHGEDGEKRQGEKRRDEKRHGERHHDEKRHEEKHHDEKHLNEKRRPRAAHRAATDLSV